MYVPKEDLSKNCLDNNKHFTYLFVFLSACAVLCSASRWRDNRKKNSMPRYDWTFTSTLRFDCKYTRWEEIRELAKCRRTDNLNSGVQRVVVYQLFRFPFILPAGISLRTVETGNDICRVARPCLAQGRYFVTLAANTCAGEW